MMTVIMLMMMMLMMMMAMMMMMMMTMMMLMMMMMMMLMMMHENSASTLLIDRHQWCLIRDHQTLPTIQQAAYNDYHDHKHGDDDNDEEDTIQNQWKYCLLFPEVCYDDEKTEDEYDAEDNENVSQSCILYISHV